MMVQRLDVSVDELWHALERTVEAWAMSLEACGREPEGHAWRVAEMALLLSNKMGLNSEDQANLVLGAFLHDIGKMHIPESILLKPGLLDAAERTLVEQHPIFARNMMLPIDLLRPAIAVPYCHHERWDGRGYPRGLKGAEIPRLARIFAVVDVWDALSIDQAYRPAWEPERVREHLEASSGTHFDPEVVDHFLVMISDGALVQQVIAEAQERPAKLLTVQEV